MQPAPQEPGQNTGRPVAQRGGVDENGNFVLGSDVANALNDIAAINDMPTEQQGANSVPIAKDTTKVFSLYMSDEDKGNVVSALTNLENAKRSDSYSQVQAAEKNMLDLAKKRVTELNVRILSALQDKRLSLERAAKANERSIIMCSTF